MYRTKMPVGVAKVEYAEIIEIIWMKIAQVIWFIKYQFIWNTLHLKWYENIFKRPVLLEKKPQLIAGW